MKNYIIGIAGNKNSGKDTVASMINYIFAVGVSKANFQEWCTKRISYDNTNSDRIIHFADNLKDVLSIIYNIPRKYFDDRKYKDELWYCPATNKFVEENAIIDGHKICIKTIEQFGFTYCFKRCDNRLVYIKLRTLMQYFGTNICRNYLGDNIWIKSTLGKIVDKANNRKLCIVPDIRFNNEAEAITINEQSLYGGVIEVKRKSNINDNHNSEIIDFTTNFIIDNNGSLLQLFYKVLEICQQIILK